MKEDYQLKGETSPVTIKLESEVADTLKKMSAYSKLSESEIVNTAVKRFIAVHSDFQPKKS
jgi:predicted transcriptional regulator